MTNRGNSFVNLFSHIYVLSESPLLHLHGPRRELLLSTYDNLECSVRILKC